MPSIIPLTYHFLLSTPSSFLVLRGTNKVAHFFLAARRMATCKLGKLV